MENWKRIILPPHARRSDDNSEKAQRLLLTLLGCTQKIILSRYSVICDLVICNSTRSAMMLPVPLGILSLDILTESDTINYQIYLTNVVVWDSMYGPRECEAGRYRD